MLNDRRVSGKREFFRIDPQTARQVIEAAAGTKLGRRFWPARPSHYRDPRWKRRRGRGGDSLPAYMAVTGVAMIAVLVFLRPPLPTWLPPTILGSLTTVEQLRSP
jgi:hypothetical protein